MIDLTGKLALVTGGSRGIGKATALTLAESGADVIINYLTSESEAETVAEMIQQIGRRAVIVKADVSQQQDIQTMMEFIGDQFERLDILVSNAASGGFRSLMEASAQNFDAAMHTNVRALMFLVQAARDLLIQSPGQAKVIALSSHGSHSALPSYGLIGSSKAALESLVRHLALELGTEGINFNVVLSGLVQTDAIRQLPGAEQMAQAIDEKLLVPERSLSPDDVANVIAFLSSPMSDLIQGETITIDGGISIQA